MNKLIFQKKLQNVVKNNSILDKKVKTQQQQQQNNKSNIKPLPEPGIEPVPHPKRMRFL